MFKSLQKGGIGVVCEKLLSTAEGEAAKMRANPLHWKRQKTKIQLLFSVAEPVVAGTFW